MGLLLLLLWKGFSLHKSNLTDERRESATDLDVLNHFEVILLALQLLLDLLVSVDDDGEEHVDQDPAHGHREEEEHHSGNRVCFLKVFVTLVPEICRKITILLMLQTINRRSCTIMEKAPTKTRHY